MNGRVEIDPKELHEKGCEYGRSLNKDVNYMREDIMEMKQDIKGLIDSVNRIERKLAQSEWIRNAATVGLSGMVSWIFNLIIQRRA